MCGIESNLHCFREGHEQRSDVFRFEKPRAGAQTKLFDEKVLVAGSRFLTLYPMC